MIHVCLYILLITFIFPNTTEKDTISILIPEVEIYGGLNESAGSTNISIIKEDKFTDNGNKNFENLIKSFLLRYTNPWLSLDTQHLDEPWHLNI